MRTKSEIGTVISVKMAKTAVVSLPRHKVHPLYRKATTRTKKIKARNEVGAQVGQKVVVTLSRPISKEVNFVITEIYSGKKGEQK